MKIYDTIDKTFLMKKYHVEEILVFNEKSLENIGVL